MVPIAFALTLGLVEFARVNMIRNTIENAALEGCRAAIVPGGTAARASTAVQPILNSVLINNATTVVTPTTITDSTPDVTVTISVPLGDNIWLTPRFFGATTMVKTCTLSRERAR